MCESEANAPCWCGRAERAHDAGFVTLERVGWCTADGTCGMREDDEDHEGEVEAALQCSHN